MPFECLRNVAPAKRRNPPLGIRMGTRKATGRGSEPTRYIYLYIGAVLSTELSFRNPEHKVHVLIGTDKDRGNIAIKLHDTTGDFIAKRQKDGSYKLTMKPNTFEGRLTDTFEEFTVEEADKIHGGSTVGQQPKPEMIMFRAGMGVLAPLRSGA